MPNLLQRRECSWEMLSASQGIEEGVKSNAELSHFCFATYARERIFIEHVGICLVSCIT